MDFILSYEFKSVWLSSLLKPFASPINKIPTVFIRYNPDTFKVNNKTINPAGVTRTTTLLKHLNYCMKLQLHELDGFVTSYYLFYDDYDKNNIKSELILEY